MPICATACRFLVILYPPCKTAICFLKTVMLFCLTWNLKTLIIQISVSPIFYKITEIYISVSAFKKNYKIPRSFFNLRGFVVFRQISLWLFAPFSHQRLQTFPCSFQNARQPCPKPPALSGCKAAPMHRRPNKPTYL